IAIVFQGRGRRPVAAPTLAVTRQALGVGVEPLATGEALGGDGWRSRHSNGLNLPPLPEAAVEALDVLDHLEALRRWHVAEARHDAVTPETDRHRATAAANAFRHGPEEIGGCGELSRRRGAELELRAGEVSRLRSPSRRKHRAHGPIALPVDAVAHHAGHRVDVTPHRDARRVLPRDVRPIVTRECVLVGHHRPPFLDRELAFPRRHGRALALERLDLAAL